ncbi:hypothetical protein BDF20DRAFT_856838 [Mycotypha africana]|uniref:uncharacterized protein n=1 Tax=Mycotypha africana TaxID=64632 RepID=UPI002301A938|nr:uncharacterized protein BDF20DRAFT_856838 [Mycotypha africana]KAI8988626.1 hypothetical protein BDF20DRAFT_856838 [Mycotypha africana]
MPTTTTLPLHHQPHHRNSISNLLINKEKTNDSIPPLPSSNTFENRTSPILSSTSRKFCALVVVTIILCYSFIKSTSFTKRENENGTTLSLSTTVSGSAVNDYLNINPLAWAPTLSDKIGKSAFSKSQFTTEALEQNELNPVSAVILRVTDDDKSIIHTVNHLLKYPFISDISIFNQVKNRPLTLKV